MGSCAADRTDSSAPILGDPDWPEAVTHDSCEGYPDSVVVQVYSAVGRVDHV